MPGTPSKTGLEILTSRSPLTADEWLELVEARLRCLKPHLDHLTLTLLGNEECMESEHGGLHTLFFDSPRVEGDEICLSIQGIFRYGNADKIDRGTPRRGETLGERQGGQRVLWGLTRKARWLIVRIEYQRQERERNRALTVNLRYVTLPELLQGAQVTAKRVWLALGETIRQLTDQRRRHYEATQELAQRVFMEEVIVQSIDWNNQPTGSDEEEPEQE